MDEAFAVASEIRYRPGKPARNAAYKRFIRRFPCLVCGKQWGVDPCHTGPHGISQRSSDMSCLPLCRTHHQEYDSGPVAFAEKHQMDIPVVVALLNGLFSNRRTGVI